MPQDPEKEQARFEMVCMSGKAIQSKCDLCGDGQKKDVLAINFGLRLRGDELYTDVWLCKEHMTQSILRFYTEGVRKVLKGFARRIWTAEGEEWVRKALDRLPDE